MVGKVPYGRDMYRGKCAVWKEGRCIKEKNTLLYVWRERCCIEGSDMYIGKVLYRGKGYV